jgi:hypothetical protein
MFYFCNYFQVIKLRYTYEGNDSSSAIRKLCIQDLTSDILTTDPAHCFQLAKENKVEELSVHLQLMLISIAERMNKSS